MSPFAALALYPLWAVALAVGLVALRLGRRRGLGLVALCGLLALWVTGLILLSTPATEPYAERVLPLGILLAGGFLHAGADLAGRRVPARIAVAYTVASAIALVGLVAPRLLYGPGARGAGPLFAPLAVLSTLGSMATVLWLAWLARAAPPGQRAGGAALALGCAMGALGGGGVIALRVYGLGDVNGAAPLLLVAVGLAAYAVFRGEEGRARGALVQGAVYALITAALSAVGLVAFYLALPALAPQGGRSAAWLVFVVFFAALPLEPLRQLIVEAAGRRIFRHPINVPELAARVETSETRSEHAERLAEIGKVASAVAHEIRNPLGVIAAQAKLLQKAGAAPETVAGITAQVDRARHFLDDLLRYGKPRPLDPRAIDAVAIVRLAVSGARQAFGAQAPEVAVEADGKVVVDADRGALTDVATVLVENALIACEARPGAKVTVRVTKDEQGLLLEVEDEGAGVPPELGATLFQPFVTGRGRDARRPGTGLGLAIAARWVERHGGTLRHERPERGGARFVARWPSRFEVP